MCDDQQLIDRVKHTLERLGFDEIEVIALGDGRVHLTGTVASTDERALILASARTVTGVKAVSIDLKLTPSS